MAKRKSTEASKAEPSKRTQKRGTTKEADIHTRAPESAIQENLVEKNNVYASSFTQGHLALPPAKHYAVGKSLHHMNPDIFKTLACLLCALPLDLMKNKSTN